MTEGRLVAAIVTLAVVGLAISGYLTWVHYAGISPVCTGISECERVQSSPYAELAGVPVALIGVAGYTAILTSLLLPGEAGRLGGALLAYLGLTFSGYLTWVELARIHAICQWCVASALTVTAIACLATARALRGNYGPGPVVRDAAGPVASDA